MGLTNSVGGGICVFSNYRKKSKDGMFQLMRHELGHAVGLRHCKTADCLIHDAEGKDLKGGKFCQACDLFLTQKGWKYSLCSDIQRIIIDSLSMNLKKRKKYEQHHQLRCGSPLGKDN